ncbi:MAG: DUF4013 domain-containing protein [Gammaproteobacteria bacterium]|nr:DUF4013 domain-containing protein [Gammaproteobacteria bacterium]
MNAKTHSRSATRLSEADKRLAAAPSVWRYFPSLARYPLHRDAFIVVLILGLGLWLMLFSSAYLVLPLALGMAFVTQYLLGVVQSTALGYAAPPPFVREILSQPNYFRLLALVLYLVPLTLLVLFAAYFRLAWLAYPLLAIGAFLLPAFIAVLALADDVREAGQPLKLRHFILQGGDAYLVVGLSLAALVIAAYALGGGVFSLLAALGAVWLLMVTCHLLGFVAFHGYAQMNVGMEELKKTEDERQQETQQAKLGELLLQVDLLLAAGDQRAACDAMFIDPGPLHDAQKFHEDLYEALRSRRQPILMLVQGKRLIHLLMQQNKTGRALVVYEQCLAVSGFFEPRELLETLQLAESALQEGRLPMFDKIASSIVQQHPGTDEAVGLQFRRVRYLIEVAKDEAGALRSLEPLLSETAHPLYPRIAALHRTLSTPRSSRG